MWGKEDVPDFWSKSGQSKRQHRIDLQSPTTDPKYNGDKTGTKGLGIAAGLVLLLLSPPDETQYR